MDFLHHIEDAYMWPFIEGIFQRFDWFAVVIMMAIESACIPLPSEIVMPFAGTFIIRQQNLGFGGILLAGLFGAIGCVIGSVLAYWVGAKGGRPLIEKYGKYILINKHHLDTADRWFEKYGEATAFFSRLLPVIRTFISFPAGVARMNFGKFVLYTFLGSFPWSMGLAWAGATWDVHEVRNALRPFDVPIVIVLLLLIAWFVFRSLRSRRQAKTEAA